MLHWGRNIFMGYLGRPDTNKETIDDEDWLRTGDVGRMDEDGYVTITGRIKVRCGTDRPPTGSIR